MLTRVTLVRHGETAWNAAGRWQGHAHVPLNDIGRQQAAQLAAHVAAEVAAGLAVATVYSSDSIRASETGRVIADAIGVPLVLDPRLRELDVGEWQGLTAEEVRTWDAERYLIVEHDPYHQKRPGGESAAECGQRAAMMIEEAVARHPGGHFLAVSHGGTIRNLLQRLGLGRADRVVVSNTSLSTLAHELSAEGLPRWSVESFNRTAHLGDHVARVEEEP